MKRFDLTRCAPPGTDLMKDIKRWLSFLACAAMFAILLFGTQLHSNYDALFEWNGAKYMLIPGAKMLPFRAILGSSLAFFYLFALYSLTMAVVYHVSYYRSSKSIYLMRRLPQRWEWLRRDLTLPIVSAILCLLAALLLWLLFLGIYYWITPAQCLPVYWI